MGTTSVYLENFSGGGDRKYTVTVTEVSGDDLRNISSIQWSLVVSGTSADPLDYSVYIAINGSVVYNQTGSASDSFPSLRGRIHGSMLISHNTDGSKTIPITLKGYAGYPILKSTSGSLVLDTLDRTAPTISVSEEDTGPSGFNAVITASDPCSQWSWRYKLSGGSYGAWQYNTTAGSSVTIPITGLSADSTYIFQFSGQKTSNGVWGYASDLTIMTGSAAVIDSAADITLGNPVNIKWTPADATHKFKLTLILHNWMWNSDFISPGSTSQYTFNSYTPPFDQVSAQMTQRSEEIRATLTTYTAAGTVLGAKSKEFTVSLPSGSYPTWTASITEGSTTSGFNRIVQGLSSVRVTITPTVPSGLAITSVKMQLNGVTYDMTKSGSTYTADTGVINVSGQQQVTVTVYDNKLGFCTDQHGFSVTPYHKPSGSLNVSITGTTVEVTVEGEISPVNNQNTRSLVITKERLSDGTTQSFTRTISSYSFTNTLTLTVSDVKTQTYQYKAIITDAVNSTTVTEESGKVALSLLRGGKGATFFAEAEDEGLWVYNETDDETTEVPYGAHGTSYESNANNITTAGTYWISTTYTTSNLPVSANGVLEVMRTGSNTSGNILQRFTKTGTGTVYERFYVNSWGNWNEVGGESGGGISLLDVYPVGAIYISTSSTSPASLFGGTWERISGRFLLAASSTYSAGSTGGSATHTPTGTVGSHTLTVNEMPSHAHKTRYYSTEGNLGWGFNFTSNNKAKLSAYTAEDSSGLESTGGGQGHNHGFTGTSQNTMPPYLAVYVWKRTA